MVSRVNILSKPLFLLALGLYITVQIWRKTEIPIPLLINNYFTDLLCLPIVLTICLAGVRLVKKIPQFELTISMIIVMTVYFSILFEIILPRYSKNYTGDYLDILCYGAGALLFHLVRRYKLKEKLHSNSNDLI